MGRRAVIKAALGGSLLAAVTEFPATAGSAPTPGAPQGSSAAAPVAALREFSHRDEPAGLTVRLPNSDIMVDVIKSLGIEYVAANPGSSFRGLHESVINYCENRLP